MATKTEKKFTFPAPEGFSLPDDTQPGEPFQSMATLQQNDDGTLQLLEIDGQPVGPLDEEAKTPPDDDEDEDGSEGAAPPTGSTVATPPPKRVPRPMAKIMARRFSKIPKPAPQS